MNKEEGIIIANGMVLKDGLSRFKADRSLVSKTLLHIAKISKGLHSGVLNGDPDFIKFQQASMEELVKKETTKLCDKVVLGAEERLMRLSGDIAAEKANTPNYTYNRRSYGEVEPIILEGPSTLRDNIPKTGTGIIKNLIEKTADDLASMNEDEVVYLKEMNKEVKKITDVRADIRKRILNGEIKKKMAKKKVAKKKTSKKVSRKK